MNISFHHETTFDIKFPAKYEEGNMIQLTTRLFWRFIKINETAQKTNKGNGK